MSVTAYVHSRDGERLRLEMMVQVLTDDRDDRKWVAVVEGGKGCISIS